MAQGAKKQSTYALQPMKTICQAQKAKEVRAVPYEDCPKGGIAIEHEIIAEPASTGADETVPEVPQQETK